MMTPSGIVERTAYAIVGRMVEAAEAAKTVLAWAEKASQTLPHATVAAEAMKAGLAGRAMPDADTLAAEHERRVWEEAARVLEELASQRE
ncbi:hypothetical protein Mmc1_0800 [Magnetococcus marinus MC-1]|uniref:Uncharacterized protein n=1 Tax=Magnetococcus marinus (strain ATCC BAA-1437 / JCM 17883 / MC-1) TaxID=156889 RepID=A0L5S7_MAGMM|nr:hypothetical protein [Magnetococcus marinus]ABK43320.1 hypothetical protein Mmc1_0800 [Magnetococcus marinus MC-1]